MPAVIPHAGSASRWRAKLGFLGIALVLALTPAAAFAQFTITRVSSPTYYEDTGLTGMYVGYEIKNTSGSTYPDIWVDIGNFTGGFVTKAQYEDGVAHLGAMAPGDVKMAYFYLDASGATALAQGHTISIYTARPPSTALMSSNFSFNAVTSVISANSNKVTVVTTGPNPSSLGGIITVTVTGSSGTIGGSGIMAFTPAAFPDWPASVFELYSARIDFSNGADAGTVTDSLYYIATGASIDYVATYLFRIRNVVTGPTSVSPVVQIASGSQIKHTNSTNFGSLTPINPPPQNFTTVAKTATPNVLNGAGTSTYTVTLTNAGPNTVEVDDIQDIMPAGSTYVVGSSLLNGSPFINPVQTGQTLLWNRIFTIPANSSINLVYQATITGVGGNHPNRANSAIDTLRIDTTLPVTDDAPAIANVYVRHAELSIVKTDSPDPVVIGQNLTYRLVITNAGPDSAIAVTATDTLPAGVTFASATTTSGSVSQSGGIVTANLGNRASGATDTVRIVVTPTVIGTIQNTARVDDSRVDNSPADNVSTTSTTVVTPDLVLDKRHTSSFTVGQTGTYTFVVQNTGTAATVGTTTVTDTLPAGLSYSSGAGAGWAFAQNGQIVTASLAGSIAVGDSSKFTLTVAISPAAFPSVTNAGMARIPSEADSLDNRDTDATTIIGVPDLVMDKRHTSGFTVGQNGTYTLVTTNLGTAATTGVVTVTDTLPAGLTFVGGAGAGWTVSNVGQIVTATNPGPIAVGDSAKVTLTVSVAPAAFPSVTNPGTLSTAGDLDPANNRDLDVTAITGVPDVNVDKRHTTNFVHGQTGTWTIVVGNPGTGATTGATTVTDTLPTGTTYVSGAGAGWTFAPSGQVITATFAAAIAAGDSAKFTLTVAVGAAAVPSVTNAAVVVTPGDLSAADNRDTDPTTVIGTPDVTLDKRHTANFVHGQNGVWTFVVTNTGTAATAAVTTVTDTLPTGTTYVSGAGAGWAFAQSGQIITATHAGPIPAADSSSFTLTVGVTASAVPGVTNAAVVSLAGDLSASNDRDTDPTTVVTADVTIDKRHVADFVHGQNGAWTIVVTNIGTSTTVGATTVTDTLPAGITYVSGVGAGWAFAQSGQVITATHAGAIPAADSASFTLTVAAGAAAVPGVTNAAVVAIAGDLSAANNRDVDPTTVIGMPDVALDKRHIADFVDGQNGTWTLVLTNLGSAATTGATTVTDTLPAGVTYVSGAGAGWTFGQTGQIITATHVDSIGAADSSSFTLTVAVAPSAVPGVSNSASVSTAGDLSAGNDRDTDATRVLGVNDLALDKRHTADFVHGQNGQWTFVVTNLGSSATSGATTVTDTLAAGITFVGGAGTGWTFGQSGQIVTATHVDTIGAADSSSFTLTVAAGAAAVPGVTNSADVATAGDVSAANNRDSDPTTVIGMPDVALDKRHAANFIHGQTGTWTFVVSNLGSAGTAGATTVTDTLPAGVTFVSAAGTGWTFGQSGQIITASHADSIGAADSSSFTLTVAVDSAAVPGVTNSAVVATPVDLSAGNNRDTDPTTVQGTPDVTLDKRHTVGFVHGQNGTWTLVVTNIGSGATLGATAVTDTLPLGTTFVSGNGSGWTFGTSGQIVTATHAGPIAAADSASFTLTVAVDAAAVPEVTNSAVVSTPSDLSAANDYDSDLTEVQGVPDLNLDKRHLLRFEVGTPGIYTFVVRNYGTTPTSGVTTVTDTLPTGLAFSSGAGAGWSFSASGQIVTATYAGSIGIADSSSFTLTVDPLLPGVPGVVNTAVVSTAGELDPADDRDVDPTEVHTVPDMTIQKRHVAPFVHRQQGTYTIVVSNITSGPSLGAMTVTDTLPAGLTFVSANGSGWSIVQSGQIVTATYPVSLAPFDSTSFTITVDVGATAVPGVINAAELTGGSDTYDGDNYSVDPTVVLGIPDLVVDKRHTAPFTHGQNGTWKIVVTNQLTGPSAGVVAVTDTLPAGVSFVSGSGAGWSFASAGQIVTATYAGAIAPGDSTSFDLTAAIGAAAVPGVMNSATVRGGADSDTTNNADSDPTSVIGVPDVTMDKRHTTGFIVGQNGTWTLVVTNAGSAPTAGVVAVTDTLPAGVSFVSGTGSGWSFAQSGQVITATHAGPIAAGDSASFDVTALATVAAFPGVVNAAVASYSGDLDSSNDRDVDSTAVAGVPDVTLDKRHVSPFTVGQIENWTMVVTNLGTAANAGAITVTDTLPAGIGFSSGAGTGWSFSAVAGIVTATHAGPLLAGDSTTFMLNVTVGVPALPGVVNSAVVSTAGDLDSSNDRDVDPTEVGGQPDLRLDKSHVGSFTLGSPGVYNFVVRNFGTVATQGAITVTDTLPAGLTYTSASGTGWSFAQSGQVVTATHPGPLAVGGAMLFSVTVAIDPSALGFVVNTATVSTLSDPNPANDTATDPTVVNGLPDLSLDKRHTTTFVAGQTADWTLVVTNHGTAAPGSAITVTDTLPAGVTYVSATSTDWSFAVSGQVVTATHLTTITEGDSSSFVVTVQVGSGAVPAVTNRAAVVTANDPNPANDQDTDTAQVASVDLAFDKRHSGTFTVGSNGDYQFIVRNVGTAATFTPFTVTDSLPAGLTFVSGSGTGWTVTNTGQVVLATYAAPLAPGASTIFGMQVAIDNAALPSVSNAAFVITGGDVNPNNDLDQDLAIVNGLPDLTIDKRHTGTFTVGTPATYTFVIRNLGTATTSGAIAVTDTLPAGLTYVSGSGAGFSFTASGSIVTATTTVPLTADPADTLVFTLTTAVDNAALPTVTNAAVVATAGDSDPLNNRDVDVANVQGLPDLSLDKRHLGGFSVGNIGSYLLVVRNAGLGATTGAITVRDTLPASLTLASTSGSGWIFTTVGQIVTATYPNPVAAGDSVGFGIDVTVLQAALPLVSNSAVATTAGDPNPLNNRDTDAATVSGIGLLVVEKTASPTQVEIGDLVDYTVTVKNLGTGPVTGTTINDVLPRGLGFQRGSARLNGVPIADPAGSPGASLGFAIGTVSPGATFVLTYRVGVGAGADLGTGTNLASATGNGGSGPATAASNTAAVKIQIRPGVFGDEGIIAGKVYSECDCDSSQTQGPEAVGIPGVRVYLEDGSFAITDVEGKYHFNHVRPRLHVVRIDATTLPAGSVMFASSHRHAQDGLSQFVDLLRGELHRADFVESSRSSLVRDVIRVRRAKGEIRDPADPGTGAGGAAVADPRGPRSLLVLGVIEGGVAFPTLNHLNVVGVRDAFMDSRGDMSFETNEGLSGSARTAFYATGNLPDSMRFTLRYDSEHSRERRLFRDLNPLEGYDVLGDASVHGWDAQSASPLYLRVDRGSSFGLFGDYTTPVSPGRQLGAFTRSLNGGLARIEAGPVEVDGYASQGRQHQVIDEFPGQGVSGPYNLSRGDGKLGSETIEILTRDRNQPSRIVRRETKLRYVDYTLEPFTGQLMFRRPVPSIDADLNPVSIRATYEAENGGEAFWVYGGEARVTPFSPLTIGLAANRDMDPFTPRAVASANVAYELVKGVTLSGEFARSDSGGTGFGTGDKSGEAIRAELVVNQTYFSARVHGLRVSTGFENPSSGVYAGRQELGLTSRVGTPATGTSLFLNALRSEDLVTTGHRDGAEAGLTQIILKRLTAEVAYRWAQEDAPAASAVTAATVPDQTSSVRGKLALELPWPRKTTLFGEMEQDLEERLQQRFGFGGETQGPLRTRLYARHENIASFAGPWALNTEQQQASTVVGVSDDGAGSTHVFSEYRMRDAIAGREAQAAIGLRNRWTVARGVRLDAAFERLTILRGGTGEATAVAGGIEYTRDPLWEGTARLELRKQSQLERWLGSLGLTRKLNRDWTALGRTTWMTVPDEDRMSGRSQFGLSFRQTDHNIWTGLARYENRYDQNGGTAPYRKFAHIVSTHHNIQATKALVLSGQFASKWVVDVHGGLASETKASLGAGRALYDLGHSLDSGIL